MCNRVCITTGGAAAANAIEFRCKVGSSSAEPTEFHRISLVTVSQTICFLGNQFSIFDKKIKGKKLTYLDSANSSQKPNTVIKKISDFYETEFSNVGRSVHTLAVKATNRFEDTRDKVKKYLNTKHLEELIEMV